MGSGAWGGAGISGHTSSAGLAEDPVLWQVLGTRRQLSRTEHRYASGRDGEHTEMHTDALLRVGVVL